MTDLLLHDGGAASQHEGRREQEAGDDWVELGQADFAAIGLATTINVAVGLLVLHIVCRRHLGPYMSKIPLLLVIAGVAVRRDSVFASSCSRYSTQKRGG